MSTYQAVVKGEPVTQGSMKGFFIGGHVVMVHQKEKELMTYRDAVRQAFVDATACPGIYFPGHTPVFAYETFLIPRPKSTPKAREYPAVKGKDIDKLERAVNDGMTGTVYDDDSQLVSVHAVKLYVREGQEPCTVITVTDDPHDYALLCAGSPVFMPKRRDERCC